MKRTVMVAVLLVASASISKAQDPVKVDPHHYKVEIENNRVRVLRISYGPHEKSVMHDHPASVVTFLTDSDFRYTTPDGKVESQKGKAGEVRFRNAFKHLPENLSDKPFEAILVELKATPAAPSSRQAK